MEHFLHFTRGERIGILVLMVLCLGLFIAPAYLPDRSQTGQADFSEFKEDINRWYAGSEGIIEEGKQKSTASVTKATFFNPNHPSYEQLKAHNLPQNTIRAWLSYIKKGGYFNSFEDLEKFRALSAPDLKKLSPYLRFSTDSSTASFNKTEESNIEIDYFSFDPKTVTKEELVRLGLPEKTANNWTKYTSNGGFFNHPEDIQKVYGLSERDYNRLLPYVVLKEKTSSNFTASNDTPKSYGAYENANSTPVIIDINQASAEEWQKLRGIGPAFSKRIVNFRNKLGGFQSVDQVAETYGLPDSVFQTIQLSLRSSPIFQTLSINHLTEKELAAHPYISFNHAKVIVQYRENHGSFTSASDLEKLYALDAETIQKIAPYLIFK